MKDVYLIEFDYWKPINLENLKQIVGAENVKTELADPKDESKGLKLSYSTRDFVMTIDQALTVSEYFQVKRVLSNSLSDQLDEIIIRLTALCKESSMAEIKQNPKCECPVPDNPLFSIKNVLLREDCCTDSLQQHLNEGWKIIAVCPQPQRRPDYILGK